MRSGWFLPILFVAACGPDGPEKGVDTTLPAEPAKISGSLTAPNEYMPSDMQVCVETPAGKTVSCAAHVENSLYSGSYEIEVPAGVYRVYSKTEEVPSYKAYYTQCGSETTCSSHAPVVVKVAEGETRAGINPNDWTNRPAPTSPMDEYDSSESEYQSDYTDMNAADMNLPVSDETASNEVEDE